MANISEFDYLCRLCATKILMGLPIFHDDLTDDQMRNIDKKISSCLPVQISLTDQLPKSVCEDCAYKLDQFYEFRQKSIETDQLFQTMMIKFENNVHVNLHDDNVNVVISDMTDINNIPCSVDNDNDNNDDDDDDDENIDTKNNTTLHTLQVIDDMNIGGSEQIIEQHEIPNVDHHIEESIDVLDGDTARLVDEHMREVSSHEMTLDIDEEMTVVGHLAINYVTNIETETTDQEQLVHYCTSDGVKFETVTNNSYDQSHNEIVENGIDNIDNNILNDTLTTDIIDTNNIPSTSHESSEIIEYTKRAQHALLESSLNNPTTDETGSHWYVCPICNEAANEPENLSQHYEEHFLSCTCGLYFTSIDDLSQHKNNCSNDNNNSDNNKKKINDIKVKKKNNNKLKNTKCKINNGKIYDDADVDDIVDDEDDDDDEEDDDNDDKKNPTNIRQKWTPKICQQCGKQYRTNYKLQEHMRKHTGEKPFKCTTCDKAFRSKIGLAQHSATHTGQFDFSCSTCGKGFQCKSYLIVHQRVHSDAKPYPCVTCGQNFKTKQSLLDHENRHLGVKPYGCDICGRSFITKGLCKSHQKTHSGQDNRQYPCEVCNKMFVSKSYLNTHSRIHTGEKPYLCEVCGKGFLTRVDLKIHSTMHTGEKKFKCEFDSCNKAFARKSALRCHTRSHNGERPYKCDVCSKTFTQFSPLAIHKRLHSGVRPYVCDICSKAFVSRSSMMCHKKRHKVTSSSSSTTLSTITEAIEQQDLKNPDSPEAINDQNGIVISKPDDVVAVVEN